MKKGFIQKIQRWTKTAISPSLDQIHWKVDNLQHLIDSAIHKVEVHDSAMHDLLEAVLFSGWEKDPLSIQSRAAFGFWLNYLRLCGEGVEIGVYRGEYSEFLLKTWKGKHLYSVDPWLEFDLDEYQDRCNVSSDDQFRNYERTVDCLSRFGNRSTILKQTSQDASTSFEDGTLDFVYIDAQHHYEAVKEDLELWEIKVKQGGVIGGHDYLDGQLESGLYGVKKAVDEWCEERGYYLLVTSDGPYPSWFVVK